MPGTTGAQAEIAWTELPWLRNYADSAPTQMSIVPVASPWPAEVHALRWYYGRPADSGCFEAVRVFVLNTPVEIHMVVSDSKDYRKDWERPWANPGRVLAGYMLRPSCPERALAGNV